MGLIGLLITLLIMILGIGYYFFGFPHTPLSINNDAPQSLTQELSQYQDIKQQAEDVKALVEQKTTNAMKSVDDSVSSPVLEKTVQSSGGETVVVDRLVAAGFSIPSKVRTIDTIVLHSSYDKNGTDPYSVSGVIKEYTDAGVSAHYLIDRKGMIYRLVEDKNIAYHAGVSKMPDGRTNVNDFSLGVEVINTTKGQYTSAQYVSVNALIASLKKLYPIKNVVGHSDIAPDRKTDPWNLDWKKIQ